VKLPITKGDVRFVVGHPDGVTSNSWKMWATPAGDVYLACRDNFTEVKVSLHTSGKWRMGFTSEALKKRPELAPNNQNRAWEVWDEPPPTLPNTVTAFRLLFLASELVVRPEQRTTKVWKKPAVYIEAPPLGKLTVLTLFVTTGAVALQHESEPSVCVASLDIGNDRRAQLIAHGDPEGDYPQLLKLTVEQTRKQAEAAGVSLPEDAYGWFFGNRPDGSRSIMGGRMQ